MRVLPIASISFALVATQALAIPYTNLPPPGVTLPAPTPIYTPAPPPTVIYTAPPPAPIYVPAPVPTPYVATPPLPPVPTPQPSPTHPYVSTPQAALPAAIASPNTPPPPPSMGEWRLHTAAGISQSRLKWNIGYGDVGVGPAQPNILSELSWQDINSASLNMGAEYRCNNSWCKRMMLFANLFGDSAYQGKNQDSDYLDDNRTNEFSRSNNDAESSRLTGSSLALGYDLNASGSLLGASLIPRIGYLYNEQTMRMRDGLQTLSDGVYQTTPVGTALTGLDSKYRARWSGFFAGLDARLYLLNRHELRAGGTLTNAKYHGIGTWNLRSDFAQPDSFEHFSRGVGRTVNAGYSFWMTPEWEFRLDGTYDIWKASNGEDITHFSGGTSSTIRFNEAKFISQTYTAGVGYKF